MCEPITLSLLGIGAAAIKTGMDLAAGAETSRAQSQQAKKNSALAELAAEDSEQRGSNEAQMTKVKAGQTAADIEVAAAGSGVDPTVGTNARGIAGARAFGSIDANTIKNNAAREAWGYRAQGADFKATGRLAEQRGGHQAFSTMLGGAAQLGASSYSLFRDRG